MYIKKQEHEIYRNYNGTCRVTRDNELLLLWSYNTLVGVVTDKVRYITEKKYSRTTSKHKHELLNITRLGRDKVVRLPYEFGAGTLRECIIKPKDNIQIINTTLKFLKQKEIKLVEDIIMCRKNAHNKKAMLDKEHTNILNLIEELEKLMV